MLRISGLIFCAIVLAGSSVRAEDADNDGRVDVVATAVEAPISSSKAIPLQTIFRNLGPSPSAEMHELATTSLDVFNECPLEGAATSTPKAELNKLKNRWRFRPSSMKAITLADMLAPGEDEDRFDTQDAVKVRGFIVSVKKASRGESTNCGATDDDNTDTHIDLAANSSASATAEENRLIIEVTPRTRFEAGLNNLDWSHANLKHLEGKCAEVGGFLFYDFDHVGQSRNDASPGSNIWRATLWEVHPITSIEEIDCAALERGRVDKTAEAPAVGRSLIRQGGQPGRSLRLESER